MPCIRDQFNSVGNMKGPGDEAASRGMGKATKRARRQRSRRADYTAAKQTVVNGRWGSTLPNGLNRSRGTLSIWKVELAVDLPEARFLA